MMKAGRVSGNVEMRSITRQITQVKQTYETGAGGFCAVFASSAVYQQGICGRFSLCDSLDRTFAAAWNQAVVAGIWQLQAGFMVFLPPEAREDTLRGLVRRMDSLCAESNIALGPVQAQVTDCVREVLMQIVMCGATSVKPPHDTQAVSGADVVVAGFAGAEGAALLARARGEELCTRYPVRMVRAAQEFPDSPEWRERLFDAIKAAGSDVLSGVAAGEGGIFGTLWELAERAGTGLRIELRALPVRQETIEICNFYNLNPYQLLSGGVSVLLCRNGRSVVEELTRRGIAAAIAGCTTGDNDRVIVYGHPGEEEKRFLEPNRTDELYRGLVRRIGGSPEAEPE